MTMIKKKTLSLILAISFSLYCLPVHSTTDTMMYNECLKDEYSFELNDANQKKIAIGMVAWGIILAAATLLLSGFIPNSPSDDATTGDPVDTGTLF